MDHILCDSELAPQLFKLIDDKLQETRKALEDTRNEKDAIQAELLRLQAVQATAGSEGSAQEDLKNTRKMLTNELEMNQRLQGENADLRGLLEGCRTAETEGTSRQDAMDASAGCPGTGCEAWREAGKLQMDLAGAQAVIDQQHTAYEELQERVGELELQVEQKESACEEQQRQISMLQHQFDSSNAQNHSMKQRLKEYEEQLARRDADVRENAGKITELQQQSSAMRYEFDQKEFKHRQELELATSKHWRYKAALEQINARQAQPASPQAEAIPAQLVPIAQPVAANAQTSCSKTSQMAPKSEFRSVLAASSSFGPRPPTPVKTVKVGVPWAIIVNQIMKNPCLSITSPTAPLSLPADVKKHLTPGSTILSCPDRIIIPHSENHIRLLAPLSRCKSAKATLDFGPPTNELPQMIGSKKEVFYHVTPTEVSYVGTYLAIAFGAVNQSEYAALPKPMKEAIVKQTFPSKTALSAVKKSNTDRLRNGYMTGKAKAQYLTLRFDGFNRSLFAALKAHAATTGSTPTAGMKRSASADAEGGAGPSKKARKAAQQAD